VLLSGLTATAQGPAAPRAVEHFAWARGFAAVTVGLALAAQLLPIVRRNALVVFGIGAAFVGAGSRSPRRDHTEATDPDRVRR